MIENSIVRLGMLRGPVSKPSAAGPIGGGRGGGRPDESKTACVSSGGAMGVEGLDRGWCEGWGWFGEEGVVEERRNEPYEYSC